MGDRDRDLAAYSLVNSYFLSLEEEEEEEEFIRIQWIL